MKLYAGMLEKTGNEEEVYRIMKKYSCGGYKNCIRIAKTRDELFSIDYEVYEDIMGKLMEALQENRK